MQGTLQSIFASIKHFLVTVFVSEYEDVISLDQFDFDLDGLIDQEEYFDN